MSVSDFQRIPPGDGCYGCPYWEELSPVTIPGGVPTSRCHYLGLDNDPLVNDQVKVCGVDLPAHLYSGPIMTGADHIAAVSEECGGYPELDS